jgi:DNA-binding transcriptional LysR family regulator
MNLNQLRALYSVIKTGAFSKAAEELFVTEPAVYIQVRSLERDLGFTLLDKFGKELRPTEMGKLLYDYADKIFSLFDEAREAVKEMQNLKKGSLLLGAAKAMAQYLMPTIVASFQDRYPLIAVHLDERSSRELVESILQHSFEMAIVARVPYPDGITFIPFSRDELILVLSPRNKLLGKKSISIQDLATEPLILTDARSATRFHTWQEFEKRGLKPAAIIEAGNTEFIKHLIKKNKGYSFLSSICVNDEIRKGDLATIPLDEGRFYMDIDIIYLRGKTLSPAATTFLHFLQENNRSGNLTELTDDLLRSTFTP